MSKRELAATVAVPVIALVIGVAVTLQPLDTLSLVLAGAMLPVLNSRPGFRLAVVLFGGLFVLQSSAGLSAVKVGYFGVVLLSSGIAMLRLAGNTDPWLLPFRRLGLTSILTLTAVVVSYPVARGYGIPTTAWFRDVVSYLLLALVLPVALDSGSSVDPRWLQRIFAGSGLLAAIGFSLDWLQRRGVSALPVGKFTLSTIALIAAPFCFGLVQVVMTTGRSRRRWFIFSVFVFVAILVTGTRTGLVLLSAFAGVAGVAGKQRIPLPKLGRLVGPLLLAVAVGVPLVGSFAISDPGFLRGRVAAAEGVFSASQTTDQSYLSRRYQYQEAWEAIRSHPFLGAGPGHVFESDFSIAASTTTIDTPFAVVAKFGLVGTALLAASLGVFASAFRRARLDIGPEVALTAARGFFVIFVCELPFGSFMEDKGLPLGLMALTALTISRLRVLALKPVSSAPVHMQRAEASVPGPGRSGVRRLQDA